MRGSNNGLMLLTNTILLKGVCFLLFVQEFQIHWQRQQESESRSVERHLTMSLATQQPPPPSNNQQYLNSEVSTLSKFSLCIKGYWMEME